MSILINNKISTTPFIRDNGWTRPLNKFQVCYNFWPIFFLFALKFILSIYFNKYYLLDYDIKKQN